MEVFKVQQCILYNSITPPTYPDWTEINGDWTLYSDKVVVAGVVGGGMRTIIDTVG